MIDSKVLTGLLTMLRKDINRILRIWSQTLLPPVVTTTLYYAIFGAFIGSQVAGVQGVSYMQFIVPGLVMMTVITSAYMNTVSTFYFAKWTRTLDELLVSPMPAGAVVTGFTLGGVARAAMVAALVIVVSLFFTGLSISVTSIGILLGAMLLTALLFSLAGLLNGMFAKSFDAISIVPTFVLTPLTYFGGVFYSIDQLPPFFRALSLANPILYMVNAFRYGFLGISDVPIATAFGVMVAMIVALLACVLWLFRKGAGIRN